MSRIYSFPPLVSETSKILILGSVPGVKSLQRQQYYAHPQNAFWKIMFQIFEADFSQDYEERKQILRQNDVALWDVIESCERKGSTDSAIRNENQNSVLTLLKNYPSISAVFCNGQKSYKNLQKTLPSDFHLPIYLLPSTSPLHTVSVETKLESWKIIKKYL